MSSTQLSNDAARKASSARAVPFRLEVVVVPVADVDLAKTFYEGLGWRLDADAGGGNRVVQMTPPGSTASIIFGTGVTYDEPGSIDSLLLAVDDIEAAREELRSHGVDVSDVFHDPAVGWAAAGAPAPRAAPRAQIPKDVPTRRMRRSAIPTATSGCCRRSPSAFRAAWSRRTSPRSHRSCTKRPSTTTASRRPRPRTTGGTGTPPT
jgi:catechol 2,3-dioxygenase-like lactoylglutathione lyase family enzyme